VDATFWEIIEESEGNPNKLSLVLAKRSSDEIVAFGREFNQALIELNRWEIWGAGYIMAGGMSDDGFHYFRSWIIGRGKEAYETALSSPDDLGKFAEPGDDFDNESLEYVALEILEERGVPDPREDFDVFPNDQPTGEAWDEEDVFEKFPKLSAQFA
jgi:hypothetical protein